MKFTFCTGTLSARTIDKRPLDVQCVPTSLTRQVVREIASEGFGEPALPQQVLSDLPEWTALAANDALQKEGGILRKFLWAVSGVNSGHGEFEPFITIYDVLLRSEPALSVLEKTAEFFPEAADGPSLKAVLFGNREEWALPASDLQELVCALATTVCYRSFAENVSLLQTKATRLMTENPRIGCSMVDQLLRASINPLGDKILTALILAMSVEVAIAIGRTQPQFIPTFFRGNARLACSAELWLIAGDQRREAFESVLEAGVTQPKLQRGIVLALLDSGSEAFIGLALSRWGLDAVFQVLDWIDAHEGVLSDTCRVALGGHVQDVMSWVHNGKQKSAVGLAAVARVVAPSAGRLDESDSTVWLQALRELRKVHRYEDAQYMTAFILALAFCNSPPAPLDLVTESFEGLHMVAERNQMRDSEWSILQPLVPDLGWHKNWDKCERMRRGLVSAFVRWSWPAWELRRLISDRDLFKQLLKSARKIDAEYYFRNA